MIKSIKELSEDVSNRVFEIFTSSLDNNPTKYFDEIESVFSKLYKLWSELYSDNFDESKYKYEIEKIREDFLYDIRNYNGINIEDNYARRVDNELVNAIRILFS